MDKKRFDDLTKLIGGGSSRRSVLKGLLGIGGAAATGGLAVDAADARTARTRPTVPPPAPPACPQPGRMCNGACCASGNCQNNLCCPAGQVNCGGACCAADKCAGTTCCAAGQEVCGTVCCTPAAPEPHSGQTSTCARDGNADFCCGTGWQCGLDCCEYEHQCCDRECCEDGYACLATVYDSVANGFEEHCCPIPQICGNTCCDGTCYDPAANMFPSLDPGIINGWATCCPSGGNVCTGPLDDPSGVGTVCCEDPTPRCCVREDQPNAGIAQCLTTEQCCFDDECTKTGPDACLVPNCEGDGTCTYTPDNALCTALNECYVGTCNPDGSCSYEPNDDLCTETGACLVGTCNTGGFCDYEPDPTLCTDTGNCGIAACSEDGVCSYTGNEGACPGACSVCQQSPTASGPSFPWNCGPAAATVECRPAGDNATCEPAVNCDGQSQTCPSPALPGNTVDCGDCSFCNGEGDCVSSCPAASCVGSVLTTYACQNDQCMPTTVDCGTQTAPGDPLCYVGNVNTLVCDAAEGACVEREGKPVGAFCDDNFCLGCNDEQRCEQVADSTAGRCEGGLVCCSGQCNNGCCSPACGSCEVCNPAALVCNDLQCQAGASCNPESGICEEGFCDESSDCPAGQGCNGVTNTCEVGGCIGAGDCPAGSGCAGGTCVANYCTSALDCAPVTSTGSCAGCVNNVCTTVTVTGAALTCQDGRSSNVCCEGRCLGNGESALWCPVCTSSRDCCSTCCHLAPSHPPCCPGGNDPNTGACAGTSAHCHVERDDAGGTGFDLEYPCLCIDNSDCTAVAGYAGNRCISGMGVPNTGGQNFCCYPDGWTTVSADHCCSGTSSGGICGAVAPLFASEAAEEVACKDVCNEGECGDIDDNCGGTINCGDCDATTTPDPGTTPAPCVPASCDVVGCGGYADACDGNGAVYCGDCCTPTTCDVVGCGNSADACDGNGPVYCGDCCTARGGDCTDSSECCNGDECRAGTCRRPRA